MPNIKSKTSRYAFFSFLQLAGMALILWDALPVYRRLFALERVGPPADEWTLWTAIIVMQFSYWYGVRDMPSIALPRSVFFGHLILFISRLSFIFASSLFALVVYRHPDAFQFEPSKVALFIAVLFSVFCFSRYLEAIGNVMNRASDTGQAS